MPESPPPRNLNPDAIFTLPKLSAEGFTYPRFPHTCVAFVAAPLSRGFSPRTPTAIKQLTPTLRIGIVTVRNPPRLSQLLFFR